MSWETTEEAFPEMKLTIDKCFIGIPVKADPETERGFSP